MSKISGNFFKDLPRDDNDTKQDFSCQEAEELVDSLSKIEIYKTLLKEISSIEMQKNQQDLLQQHNEKEDSSLAMILKLTSKCNNWIEIKEIVWEDGSYSNIGSKNKKNKRKNEEKRRKG